MKRYIALLRGINISGKNKVPMAELKKGFETLAFVEVKTYLNSGNVIFSSDEDNIRKLTDKIEEMISCPTKTLSIKLYSPTTTIPIIAGMLKDSISLNGGTVSNFFLRLAKEFQ